MRRRLRSWARIRTWLSITCRETFSDDLFDDSSSATFSSASIVS